MSYFDQNFEFCRFWCDLVVRASEWWFFDGKEQKSSFPFRIASRLMCSRCVHGEDAKEERAARILKNRNTNLRAF